MTIADTSPNPSSSPSSILIIGSGVFGLSTAFALSTRSAFANTRITLVDRTAFPAPDASSIDSSRIIRADYAKGEYATLAREAQRGWRGEWGKEGRYSECGLCLVGGGYGLESAGGNEGEGIEREAEMVEYVRKSLENVLALEGLEGTRDTRLDQSGDKRGGEERGAEMTERKRGIEVLPTQKDIKRIMHGGGGNATIGYVNWNSGWADAEASMAYLLSRVQSLNRVKLITGKVKNLLFSSRSSSSSSTSRTVTGALLTSGKTVSADLTVLAAGPWTPSLLDLRGICSATAQCIAYTPITPSEHAELSKVPVILDMQSGYFIIPPNPREKPGLLKLARHTFGYANPTLIQHPEAGDEEGDEERQKRRIITSVPMTAVDDPTLQIPLRDQVEFKRELHSILPPNLKHISARPFANTRLCYYADTPTGDFLIDYHPRYGRSLFVATGGSGHGFKFLPVIGERVVDLIEGRKNVGGVALEELWAWPRDWEERREAAVREGGGGGQVWTEDGSRGGVRGLVLREELERGRQLGRAGAPKL